jgi:hypothetical protein
MKRFGLRYSFLTMDETRPRRLETAERLILDIAREWLADDEAHEMFGKLAKRKKGKRSKPDTERLILKAHDEAPKSSKSKIAQQLFQEHGQLIGNSSAAIEQHLRRLLGRRTKHRDRIEAVERQLKSASWVNDK